MSSSVDLTDYDKHPGMVRWFRPSVLLDAGRRAIVSALFGSYADRRLIQAALDQFTDESLKQQCDYTGKLKTEADGSLWIDYVADLGDGFDSTYAVAYLLAQKSLAIGDEQALPRGQALIMGGDEVYPVANRQEYDRRLKTPYRYAFPYSNVEGSAHPYLFLIPGNHDWYDGLTLFLALFCRGRKTFLGSWQAWQSRSYFAIRLPGNWWIWACDTQLGEDIDQPQAAYFHSVVKKMADDARVILCTSVPTWLKADKESKDADDRDEFFRGLNYVAYDILKRNRPAAKICAVLSGDLHHYSRYSALESGTQFITAGGGGAFLHPTHQLKDRISAKWLRGPQTTLSLRTDPKDTAMETDKDACFPSREQSRRLSLGNLRFAWKNWELSLTLGAVYAIVVTLVLLLLDEAALVGQESWWASVTHTFHNVAASPAFWVLYLLLLYPFVLYADTKKTLLRWFMGACHWIFHAIWMVVWLSILPATNHLLFGLRPGGFWYFILCIAETAVIAGFLGGVIWGLYLVIVNAIWGLHENDAFSAMRLDSHRHFLRLRIKGDTLTIYPIGLERSPRRDEWRINPHATAGNQNEPVVIPKTELTPILIEGPIAIDAGAIR